MRRICGFDAFLIIIAFAGGLAVLSGCSAPEAETPAELPVQEQDREPPTVADSARPDESAAPADAAGPTEPDRPAPKVPMPLPEIEHPIPDEMPAVVMSESHRDTCLVGVGDRFPQMTLPDVNGQQRVLADTMGESLTVVVFWSTENPYSVAELAELSTDVEMPFAAEGLEVVAINEGDSLETVHQIARDLDANFDYLLDPGGELLAKVATGGLPRTYLLDPNGTILWFDIEYSRSTRRELIDAIRYALAHVTSVAQNAP